jgi:hypothetical protein
MEKLKGIENKYGRKTKRKRRYNGIIGRREGLSELL